MVVTINEMVSEILQTLGLDRDKINGEAIARLRADLDEWQDDAYNDGCEDGKASAEKHDYPEVDCTTLGDLEVGIELMRRGDAHASTYLDRALRDFGSSYY